MPRCLALLVLLVLGVNSGCAVFVPTAHPTRVVRGPLGVKTGGPIVATLLQFRPRQAETTPPGRLRFECTSAYSSVFEDGTDGSSTVLFDGELLRTGFSFRTGVSPTTDVEIEVPIAYASSGFLDTFIESWHGALGLPNGGRKKRDKGAYDMHVEKDGQRVFELEPDRPALGDVPIVVTQRIAAEDVAGVSIDIRGGVELPTGSQSRGVGNGGFDWGGGALVEKSFDRFTLGAGAYFVEPPTADSFARADVETQQQSYVHAGLECRWNEWVSVVAGLRSSTPATRDVTIEEVNGRVLDLDAGFVFDDPQTERRFVLGLTEDLVSESGPDFTVFFAWSFVF
jgi:hypothetical protein